MIAMQTMDPFPHPGNQVWCPTQEATFQLHRLGLLHLPAHLHVLHIDNGDRENILAQSKTPSIDIEPRAITPPLSARYGHSPRVSRFRNHQIQDFERSSILTLASPRGIHLNTGPLKCARPSAQRIWLADLDVQITLRAKQARMSCPPATIPLEHLTPVS